MRITKNGEAMCRNDEGTCERALCECDAMFAREHVAASSVYTDDNHMFYSKTGWNPEEECIAGGGSTDPKCLHPDCVDKDLPRCFQPSHDNLFMTTEQRMR